MAFFLLICGAFLVFIGVILGLEAITTTTGVELVMCGFMSLICIVGGLMFIALLGEM